MCYILLLESGFVVLIFVFSNGFVMFGSFNNLVKVICYLLVYDFFNIKVLLFVLVVILYFNSYKYVLCVFWMDIMYVIVSIFFF